MWWKKLRDVAIAVVVGAVSVVITLLVEELGAALLGKGSESEADVTGGE